MQLPTSFLYLAYAIVFQSRSECRDNASGGPRIKEPWAKQSFHCLYSLVDCKQNTFIITLALVALSSLDYLHHSPCFEAATTYGVELFGPLIALRARRWKVSKRCAELVGVVVKNVDDLLRKAPTIVMVQEEQK